MGEGESQARRAPRGLLPLAFALSALASSWNPLAAPIGLVVGIVSVVLAARALRAPSSRRLGAAALGAGVLAVAASAVMLLLTAGAVGVDLGGEPVVKGRTPEELERVLSEAGDRTRARRERALRELGSMSDGRHDGGGPPARRPPSGRDAGPNGGPDRER
jgi:hypothetical protein